VISDAASVWKVGCMAAHFMEVIPVQFCCPFLWSLWLNIAPAILAALTPPEAVTSMAQCWAFVGISNITPSAEVLHPGIPIVF
jgi:hypothetical protein